MDLNKIVKCFIPDSDVLYIKPYGNGHINSTYKVAFSKSENEYILQKINTNVFKCPDDIIQNHFKLQECISSDHENFKIPHLIQTSDNKYLYRDENQNVWRLMNFIKDSYSIDIVTENEHAYEAGKGFGWFLKEFTKVNPSDFKEAIKDFHSLSFRLKQFNDAINKDSANRLLEVKEFVNFYKERVEKLLQIQEEIKNNEIPTRVVHNDTKINNLLFRDNQAVAVIDLDTVGPGTVVYDYGDALRTICNMAAEDEKDLSKVGFNIEAFRAFTIGYLNQTKSILNINELNYLHLAPIYMTFIMGIRFLTDYLNGDIYYKINYNNHNLVRSKVQMKLIECMETRSEEMKLIIKNEI